MEGSGVGERALAACHRRADLFDLYRSQWAGSDSHVGAVLGQDTPGAVLSLADACWHAAGQQPFGSLVGTLDYLATEVLYCLTPAGVTVYATVWAGVPGGGPLELSPTCGALVRIDSLDAYRRLRRRSRRTKEYLLTLAEDNQLGLPKLISELRRLLRGYEYHLSPDFVAVQTTSPK